MSYRLAVSARTARIKGLGWLGVVAALVSGGSPLGAFAQAAGQAFEKSYALVVGIDHYTHENWPQLGYAVKDARAVAQYLAGQGFEVTELYDADATANRIQSAIEDDIVPLLTENDRVFVFFAGHGATRVVGQTDRGYLVPVDGTNLFSTLIPVDDLHYMSSLMQIAKHQLFILDSCFGGLAATRSGTSSIDPRTADYVYEITRRKARQMLTAGGADQRVQDGGPDGHSKFTGQLLRALRDGIGDSNGDSYITFSELSSYLQRAASDYNQTPGVAFLNGHEQGDFLFTNPQLGGSIVPTNTPQAGGGATRGAAGGNAYQSLVDGKRAFVAGNMTTARQKFTEAADLGNAEGMFYLGVVIWQVDTNYPLAIERLSKAAERGHVDAMRKLIEIFGPRSSMADPAKANYWRQQLAEAEALAANTTLIDPSGQAGVGEPQIRPDATILRVPMPPTNLTVN